MLGITAILFVAGLVAGSFVSVVAHRLPRKESIVGPRSKCPHCDETIAAYDNVPVLSWLALRGRCRRCGERISPRYPLVELALGILYAVVYLVLEEDAAEVALGIAFVTMLATITLTDLEHRIIPNAVLIAGDGRGARDRHPRRSGLACPSARSRPRGRVRSCSSQRSRTRGGWAWAT